MFELLEIQALLHKKEHGKSKRLRQKMQLLLFLVIEEREELVCLASTEACSDPEQRKGPGGPQTRDNMAGAAKEISLAGLWPGPAEANTWSFALDFGGSFSG